MMGRPAVATGLALAVALLANLVESRPRLAALGETVMETGSAGSGIVADGAKAVRVIFSGARDLTQDIASAAVDTTRRFNDAAIDTAQQMIVGFRDSARATSKFVADGARATGALTSSMLGASMGVARDAVAVTGDWIQGLSGRTVEGVVEAGGALHSFVEDVVSSFNDYTQGKSKVLERVLVRGTENLAMVPQPAF
ncbi:hypothetical protein Pmani_003245 [Petrolisthes manimaculis]|uniref:Uncharacterized protein n=1 Tax=Petrolisthes manimaculis TaxID=1843537 RepID=A0AAE1UMP1_9EUCA|nr:hypothetical protein Pmani_003245 [Petrolisthes manimaculis]